MIDEPTTPDGPAGDGAPPGTTGRASPPASRAVAMFAVVLVVLALIAAAAWFAGGSPSPIACKADGLLGPNGETYGRDPSQDCQFVDGDGKVVPGQ